MGVSSQPFPKVPGLNTFLNLELHVSSDWQASLQTRITIAFLYDILCIP